MAGTTVAKFRDVANDLQKGQFAVGEHVAIRHLSDLDPIYKAHRGQRAGRSIVPQEVSRGSRLRGDGVRPH